MSNRFKAGCQILRSTGSGLHPAAAMALGLLAIFAASLPAQGLAQGGPTPVEVDLVISEPLSQTQPVQGRFVARQAGPVAAQTRGAVLTMHVFVGDTVRAGDPIATLDTGRLSAVLQRRRAEVQYRSAQVAGAEARYLQSTQELARLERLQKSAAFSKARFDDQASKVVSSKSEIAEAQAQLETAKAELGLAEIDLAKSVVAAPFSGVVTQRHTQPGAYLQDGDPVVDLVDQQSLEIEADVPASRVSSLKKGMKVLLVMDGETELTAVVRAIIPQENTLSRTRAVRFSPSFDPAETSAAAEAAVTVRVPVGLPRDVVTVHKDAIVQQGGTVVYVVEDGKANRKHVTLGESAGNRFVVENGLTAGMVVVVRGNERLRPGQSVQYKGMEPPKVENSSATPSDGRDGKAKPAGAKKDTDS